MGHVSADDFVHCEDRKKRKTDLKLNFHHVPSSTNLIQSSLWMVSLLLKRGKFILLPPGGSVVPRRVLPTSESSKHPELKVETKSQGVSKLKGHKVRGLTGDLINPDRTNERNYSIQYNRPTLTFVPVQKTSAVTTAHPLL